MIAYEIVLLACITIFIIGYAIGGPHLREISRVLVTAIALLFLVAAAITTVLGQRDFAEQLAIMTYYLLITVVILYLMNFIREGTRPQ